MTSSTTPDTPAAVSRSSLPNALTLARLAAAPVIAALIYWAGVAIYTEGRGFSAILFIVAFVLFLAAALTDWLDGAMARKLNAISPLGAALDHAADKALVAAALIALAATTLPFDLVIAATIIVVRDVAVAGLREGLALDKRALPVSSLGKLKTVVELVAIGLILAWQIAALSITTVDALWILDTGNFAMRATLWAAAALAVWSGGEYLARALRG